MTKIDDDPILCRSQFVGPGCVGIKDRKVPSLSFPLHNGQPGPLLRVEPPRSDFPQISRLGPTPVFSINIYRIYIEFSSYASRQFLVNAWHFGKKVLW